MPCTQHSLPFEYTAPGFCHWLIFTLLCVASYYALTSPEYFIRQYRQTIHLIARRHRPRSPLARVDHRRDGRRNGFIDPSDWDDDYYLRRLGSRNDPIPSSIRDLQQRLQARRGGACLNRPVSDDEDTSSQDGYDASGVYRPQTPQFRYTGGVWLPSPQSRERMPLEFRNWALDPDRKPCTFAPTKEYRGREEAKFRQGQEKSLSPSLPHSCPMFGDPLLPLGPGHRLPWVVNTDIEVRTVRHTQRGVDGRFVPRGFGISNAPAESTGDQNAGDQNQEGLIVSEQPPNPGLRRRSRHRRVYTPYRAPHDLRSGSGNRRSQPPAPEIDDGQQAKIPPTTHGIADIVTDNIGPSQPTHTERQREQQQNHEIGVHPAVGNGIPRYANAAPFVPRPEFQRHVRRMHRNLRLRGIRPPDWPSSSDLDTDTDPDSDAPHDPSVVANQPHGANQQPQTIHEERQHRSVPDTESSIPTSSRSSSPNAPKNPYVLANNSRDVEEQSRSQADLGALGRHPPISRQREVTPTEDVTIRRVRQRIVHDTPLLPPHRVPNVEGTGMFQNRWNLARSTEVDGEDPEFSHRTPTRVHSGRRRVAGNVTRRGGRIRLVPGTSGTLRYQARYESEVEENDEVEGNNQERDM